MLETICILSEFLIDSLYLKALVLRSHSHESGLSDLHGHDDNGFHSRNVDDLYSRDYNNVYARDVDSPWTTDVVSLSRPKVKQNAPSRRDFYLDAFDQLYRREPASFDGHFHRRVDTGSSDSGSSPGSVTSVATVAMDTQATATRKVIVHGVNGCRAVFVFGKDFITGADIRGSEQQLEQRARKAGSEARTRGVVTSITIKGPDKQDAAAAGRGLKRMFANVPILEHTYGYHDDRNGRWEFTVRQVPVQIRARTVEELRPSFPDRARHQIHH